jgi:hypothetical protein
VKKFLSDVGKFLSAVTKLLSDLKKFLSDLVTIVRGEIREIGQTLLAYWLVWLVLFTVAYVCVRVLQAYDVSTAVGSVTASVLATVIMTPILVLVIENAARHGRTRRRETAVLKDLHTLLVDMVSDFTLGIYSGDTGFDTEVHTLLENLKLEQDRELERARELKRDPVPRPRLEIERAWARFVVHNEARSRAALKEGRPDEIAEWATKHLPDLRWGLSVYGETLSPEDFALVLQVTRDLSDLNASREPLVQSQREMEVLSKRHVVAADDTERLAALLVERMDTVARKLGEYCVSLARVVFLIK